MAKPAAATQRENENATRTFSCPCRVLSDAYSVFRSLASLISHAVEDLYPSDWRRPTPAAKRELFRRATHSADRYRVADLIATLKAKLPEIADWAAEDQRDLAQAARDIEACRLGVCSATPEELEGVDAGLADLRQGRIATPDAVAAMRARIRSA